MGDADLGCPIHIHLVMLGVVVAYSHPTSITSGSPPPPHTFVSARHALAEKGGVWVRQCSQGWLVGSCVVSGAPALRADGLLVAVPVVWLM